VAYASIVFGALALLFLATSIGLGIGTLADVSPAAALIGAIPGARSQGTKQGKAGLILSFVSLFIVALVIAYLHRLLREGWHPPLQVNGGDQSTSVPTSLASFAASHSTSLAIAGWIFDGLLSCSAL
jgi:hypothetical protein